MDALTTVERAATNAIEIDREVLRGAIKDEYAAVASEPQRGFHFHTGRKLARMLDYEEAWLEGVPETAIESFAGTGNPFALGPIREGERVLDIGCGAGIDSLVAAGMVGPEGRVVGVDMTPAMVDKARDAAEEGGFENVDFREAYAEALPLEDGWADLVISNGVFNLFPDKPAALREIRRVLRPGGRLQFGDILVERPVNGSAKQRIDLWTG